MPKKALLKVSPCARGSGELTGAERKAFAAEVGRILAKMIENGQNEKLANGQNEVSGHWLVEMANTSGTPFKTLQNWWSAFCRETGRSMTPKQAGDTDKQAFFAWLDAQKKSEEEEKARNRVSRPWVSPAG